MPSPLCDRCLRPVRIAPECTVCNPDVTEPPPEGEPVMLLTEAFSQEAIDWGRTLAAKHVDLLTDDEAVIVRVIRRGWLRASGLAYVASVFARVKKAEDEAKEAARFAKDNAEKALTGSYWGTVGQKSVGRLKCEAVVPLGTNQWGKDSFLIRFSGPNGEEVVWFTSSGSFDPKPGESYDIEAKVTRHEPYGDRRQTAIQRPKVLT